MAGQRASTPYGGAELRREESAVPSQRGGGADADGVRGDSGPVRERARRAEPSGSGRLPAALPAIGLPVLGALVDEVTGSGVGPVFAVCAVLGTALAAAVSSRAGWWWVTAAAPAVVLAVASGTEYLVHGDKYQGKALATGALRWVVHAFPVMAAAVPAALLVIVVRSVRSGRGRRG
ncbi:DUF6542 domain-containing protein [Kitasatospora sp. GP82]|uniref:DUF6542 domain-containing protein n=1 Tax=Kitasatospora sp. GP82 TaxID=3035089 RepID=UPI00247480E0|nr:DUF6542 domain-containing protein [Kitasatospora sp. GP82]MDH6123878.1 hypothetical protein [Kitasatospora sp. GP82]